MITKLVTSSLISNVSAEPLNTSQKISNLIFNSHTQ